MSGSFGRVYHQSFLHQIFSQAAAAHSTECRNTFEEVCLKVGSLTGSNSRALYFYLLELGLGSRFFFVKSASSIGAKHNELVDRTHEGRLSSFDSICKLQACFETSPIRLSLGQARVGSVSSRNL